MRRSVWLGFLVLIGLGCGSEPRRQPPPGGGGGNNNSNNNQSSGPTCGDGRVEGDEVCDGANLGSVSCETFGLEGGPLLCGATCKFFDMSGCTAPATCGNGVRDANEACEGSDLGGQTCMSLGFAGGNLACQASCVGFDTSGCMAECMPDCSGRQCGPDPVCGTSCGMCSGEDNCNAAGQCEAPPRPTRFDSNGAQWSLPSGGYSALGGFWNVADQNGAPDDGWATLDLTGDGRADLVITRRNGTVPGNGAYWLVHENTGAGFAPQATQWSLPSGGYSALGGFWNIADQNGAPDDGWATLDVTGDGRPDLVITRRNGVVPGNGAYWLVHENTGSGFAPQATQWGLPSGGYSALGGFWNIADQNGAPDDGWATLDMNGDQRPDLVVTRRNGVVPGNGAYWLVHENTGSGFAPQAAQWNLPTGGYSSLGGFWNIADQNGAPDDGWATLDMNGDRRPDLVITRRNGPVPGNGAYWLVHMNDGGGFAESAMQWSLPSGGYSTLLGFWNIADQNGAPDDGWATVDMNGDLRPDLVVTRRNGTVPGNGAYWLVHTNDGSGFASSAAQWSLPAGGLSSLGGFWNLADQNGAPDDGWSTLDLDGDRLPDLVVTRRNGPVPGGGTHWLVHRAIP